MMNHSGDGQKRNSAMGLYDTIKIKCVCPMCRIESLIPFQTKSLDNKLQVFTPGDRISEFNDEYDFLELAGICKSDECLNNDPEDHGTIIRAKIRLRNGIITNDLFDISLGGINNDES